jgi:hypothetical protein
MDFLWPEGDCDWGSARAWQEQANLLRPPSGGSGKAQCRQGKLRR